MQKRLLNNIGSVAVTALAGIWLAGCGGGSGVLGNGGPPDETMVLENPPLTIPPNFDLRPPRTGDDRAEELLKPALSRQSIQQEVGADAWLLESIPTVDPNIRTRLPGATPGVVDSAAEPAVGAGTPPAVPSAQPQEKAWYNTIFGGGEGAN